jgi:hypothetical protein
MQMPAGCVEAAAAEQKTYIYDFNWSAENLRESSFSTIKVSVKQLISEDDLD